MILYVAGPMTGIELFNYPAFNAAAADLRAVGYEVQNPAEPPQAWMPAPHPQGWNDYMRNAICRIARADGIAVLPGWEESRGARLEVALAHDLDIPVYPYAEWIIRAATDVQAA